MKRRWFRWIKIFIIVYCVIGIALYYVQDNFILHPTSLPVDYTFSFDTPFEEAKIPFNATDTLSFIKFFPPAPLPTKGLVLYFHGNQQNVLRYAKYASLFTQQGYQVWMPDYPGFGKSTGDFTERKLYEQAFQLKRMASNFFKDSQIVVYGKSLGTGVASFLASNGTYKALVLETPYSSIPDLFSCYAFMYPTSYMSHFKFPVKDFLPDVLSPVIVFHGNEDGVIPYRCASTLQPILKSGDRFITIEGGSHNNLTEYPLYKETMKGLLH